MRSGGEVKTRLAYAAAHIVMRDAYRDVAHTPESPGRPEEIAEWIDWEATRGVRAHLDAHGFGIAEAMDTAQRFSIGWTNARRLIEECGALKLANGFIAGAGVDHLEDVRTKTELVDGVVYQARTIQAAGGEVILLPLPWLPRNGASEADYVEVYGSIIAELEGPLAVHWLGEMFLPELAGYFPGDSFTQIMALDPSKVRGAKLSLLDAELEVRLRRELATRDQIMLTGDDFHFARLILGGDASSSSTLVPEAAGTTRYGQREVATGDFSHALLGVLDGIAEPAGLALQRLASGDGASYLELMTPCEALGRTLFEAPTAHYKAGLAFLAWLNGRQPNAMLANHEERSRSRDHYLRVAELAARAGALQDGEDVRERQRAWRAAPG
jgi:hypothetical protein